MLVTELLADNDRGAARSIRLAPRSLTHELVDVEAIPVGRWEELAARAVEPNIFYEPAWMRAVSRHARDYRDAKVLLAWDGPAKKRLLGLMPVWTAWRALKLPLPAFIAWQAYAPLRTPLLDREMADAAAHGLIDAAIGAGAEALYLPLQTMDGMALRVLRRALKKRGFACEMENQHERARLNTTRDADTLLLGSLGAKKMKELRRQRNRLGDHGEVSLKVFDKPAAVHAALERFLALEASGWKGKRGTALVQNAGDAAFIREAAKGLAARGQFEVLALNIGERLAASCLVIKGGRQAYFFKLAHDESESKNSPGVQITLDLTRHLCADHKIEEVDSTADSNHPMIDHIWRDRLSLADVFVPLTQNKIRTAAIHGAIRGREHLRQSARRLLRQFRMLREKWK
ncbi:MAG TPA: GNAT family N-acetyltransferase [Xanthobacteraceae bacterium]|nr:GNAT family N-acetyltransferase [Xanthobacteraceae bacterium]